MPTFTVAELAQRVAGAIDGDGSRLIAGVASIDAAGPDDLTFISEEKYVDRIGAIPPGSILVEPELRVGTEGTALIRVGNPHLAFAQLVPLFYPTSVSQPGIATSATLGHDVRLGEHVTIGSHVLIGDGAHIGHRTHIEPFTIVEAGVQIGEDCRIGYSCSILAGVRLGDRVQVHTGVRIGTEGFGYARGPEGAVKVPQVGGCIIGDDVEIGTNSAIDRGALGDTVIGARTKIDNLVHIGHNVQIGEDCMIVAQVGLAGSVRIGQGAALGGQAGVSGHLTIGPGARIGAQAGVTRDVPGGADYCGFPARPLTEVMRGKAAVLRLPEALRRLSAVERALGITPQGNVAAEQAPDEAEATDVTEAADVTEVADITEEPT
jgi:UDP-3-O-[3-hydroxymyristoyl] glucosamine N-acyltransferase